MLYQTSSSTGRRLRTFGPPGAAASLEGTMHQDYRPASDVLKERVVLVTGAGDGIGRPQRAREHGAEKKRAE